MNSKEKATEYIRNIGRASPVFLDTETTGLGSSDQVIQVAIINYTGDILLSTFVRPTVIMSTDAFKAHGITDDTLSRAPYFEEVWPFVIKAISTVPVVVYNASFDHRLILQSGVSRGLGMQELGHVKFCCLMTLYAEYYGELTRFGSFRYQKLSKALTDCSITIPEDMHSALVDAEAARQLFKRMESV